MKKFLSMIMCVLMVVSFMPTTAFADDIENPDATNQNTESVEENSELDMTKMEIEVTPSNVQDVLDGKYGSIDGKTIMLTAGDYGMLYLRQSLAKVANTEQTVSTKRSDLENQSNAYPAYYRAISNVAIKAADGANVTCEGFKVEAGLFWWNSAPASNQEAMGRTNSGFISYLSLKNITIEGIKFDNASNSAVVLRDNAGSQYKGSALYVDGFTIKNCSGTGTTTKVGDNWIGFFKAGTGAKDANFCETENVKGLNNITITGCEITSYYQPICFNNNAATLNGLTVSTNTFTSCINNQVQVSNKVTEGTLIFTGNKMVSSSGRFLRMAAVQEDAKITLSDNIFTNPIEYNDVNNEIYKITGTAGFTVNGTVTTSGTWTQDGEASLLPAAEAKINDKEYKTLQAAVDAASVDQTIELLRDVTITESITINKPVTIDGDGHTITMTYGETTNADAQTNAIFNDYIGNEGIVNSFTVKNLNMEMSSASSKEGYAFVAGRVTEESEFGITFENCSFKNMFCGAMLNGCRGTVGPDVTIKGCTFEDVSYGLSFAEKNYAGKVSFENNTMSGETAIQETFKDAKYIQAPTFTITSGTFSADPSAYLEDGYVATNNDGTWTVKTSGAVAKIGDSEYNSLAKAVKAVENDQTIQLVDDVTLNGRLTIQVDKTFTIDLGGHTLTGRTDIRQGNVTIKNGTVKNTTQPLNVYGSTVTTAKDYSVLTISKNVDVKATENVVCMMNAEGNKTYGAIINIAGNIEATGSGNDAAVFVSGNIGNSDSGVDITAMNKNNIINITGKIAGGKIVAMAMNGQATVNVKSSASISGATGINVKRGTLNVEGGTIQGKGDKVDPVTANTNGAENTGAGVSVTSTYNYAGLIDINITGGTIASKNNVAFYIGHSKKDGSSVAFKKGVSTKLAGGNFVGATNSAVVYVAEKINNDAGTYTKAIISGGTYSSDPSVYCTSDVLFIAGTDLQKTGSLASVGAISAKTWKLTVRDTSKAITTGTATYVSGQALVSVPVTVSGSGLDQVSVVITSGEAPSGSNILYYGKLDGVDTSAIGRQTGTFTLPENLPDGYKVYLLAEDINTNTATGAVTDYASEPVELTLIATTEETKPGEDGTVTKTITVGEKTIVETTTTTAIEKGNTITTVENKTVEDKVNNTKTTATVTKTSTGSGITSTTTNKTVTKLNESGNETKEKEEITTKVTETTNQKITEETKTVLDSEGNKTGEEKTETTVTTQNNKTETTEVKTVTAGALATKTETKKVEANNITTTEKTVTKTSNGGNPVVVATKTVEDTANDVAVETVVEGETAKVEAKIAENLTSSGSEGAAEAPATITVDATAAESVKEEVKAAEVTLPATTVTALKKIADTSGETKKVETVELKTNVATLQISNDALKTLTDGADETKPLVLTVEKKETSPQQSEGSTEIGSTSGNVKATFELTAKIGGEDAFKEDSNNDNGTITINVSYEPTSSSNRIEVYYVNGSIRKPMGATYNKSKGILTWGTDHFSTFEVEESASQGGGSSYDSGSIGGGGSSSGAAAADETKDNAEDTDDAKAIEEKMSKAKAKDLVEKITSKPSVSQTKQGNIKVTFKVNEKKIQAFKDLGYTVKYKFYRSTKKSSGYKAKAEKAKKTYTDKTGKKGTKYYYKVRVMVYDAQGKVIAKTSLKQCKYVASVK